MHKQNLRNAAISAANTAPFWKEAASVSPVISRSLDGHRTGRPMLEPALVAAILPATALRANIAPSPLKSLAAVKTNERCPTTRKTTGPRAETLYVTAALSPCEFLPAMLAHKKASRLAPQFGRALDRATKDSVLPRSFNPKFPAATFTHLDNLSRWIHGQTE